MQTETISFKNSQGLSLSAKLDTPDQQTAHTYAIFAHCFTCHKDLTAIVNICRALTAQGIAVLRFDFTGLGRSEGSFAQTSLHTNITDLEAAANYLVAHHEAPRLIIGHSFGGAAALYAAKAIESIKAVVTIASPATTEHVQHLFKSKTDEIQEKGEAVVRIGGHEVTLGKVFLDDIFSKDMPTFLKGLHKPLLVFHSPQDSIVTIDNAQLIYQSAKHPKSFISLNGADHMLSNRADACYVGAVIASWAVRYVSNPVAAEEAAQTQQPSDHVLVKISGDKQPKFKCDVIAGNHVLVADEPISFGGNDMGNTPYDYLKIALGACTAMTMKMYAQQKGWAFESVSVALSHEKVKQANNIDRFTRNISIHGDLTDEQKQQLLAIADKCPVHKTLSSPAEVVTEITLGK